MLLLFFKQKTAYEMRISDWSSDVCSSDLPNSRANAGTLSSRKVQITGLFAGRRARVTPSLTIRASHRIGAPAASAWRPAVPAPSGNCRPSMASTERKSGVEGKSVSVRVEHGGRRTIKKKNKTKTDKK